VYDDFTSVIWRIGLALSGIAWFASGIHAAGLPRTVVWSAEIQGVSSPAPYPSADAAASVIVSSGVDNRVLRITGKGQIAWGYDMGDVVTGMVASADIDGDGQVEIVACTARGRTVALSGDGKAKWSYETRHRFGDFANVALSRRPQGGGCDVLIHSRDGWLTCLDGHGRLRWEFRIALPGHISAPAIADLNGDSKPEYVCGVDAERVIAVTDGGRLLWEFVGPEEYGREAPVIADADRDGKPEVYTLKAGATSAMFCIDGPTGKLIWMQPIGSKCYCAVTVADINGDGYDEVLAGTKYGNIIAYSHTGEKLWMQTVGGSGIFSSPAVGDVDGDGRLEIVTSVRGAATDGNSIYVLDTQGNILGAYPQAGEADSSAIIADVDHDGLLEVISRSANAVWCYRFGNPTKAGKVLWPCYRANAAATGCQLPLPPAKGAVAKAPAPPTGTLLPRAFRTVLGDTDLTAQWSRPTPERGYVEVELTDPRGARLIQAFRASPDKRKVALSLPFLRRGRYRIDARLLDTVNSRVLVAESKQVTFEPLATEGQMVKAANKDSMAAASAIPASAPIAAELERRRSALSAALRSVKVRLNSAAADAPMPPELLAAAASLRAQTSREEKFTTFARKVATAPNMLFATWQDADPWDYTDPRDDLSSAAAETVSFSAWTYGNQREDFCLNLMSLAASPFDVRVEPADLVGPGGATAPWERHLTLLDVVWMPTTLNPTPVPDMLPAMNAGRTVQLAPGGFAQVWMVVDTKDLAPGEWAITLHLQSLTMAAAAVDATLKLDVLPVALPFPYPWKMCNWSWPTSFPQPLRDRIIDNLISHGSNVIYAPTPSRACDAEGNLSGAVDWGDLDELVARAKPGDPFLFFGTLPMTAPAGMTNDSPVWRKAYKQWMAEFVAHLASIGIDYRHFAFYPVDEPGNSGHTSIDQLIAAAKVLREADPLAPIYADPAGGAYTTEWIRKLDPWVDVWAPASGLSSRADIHAIISTRNREVWMYDAPGEVRMLPPLGFYRRQPWSALRDGARGSGFWVYYYSNLWATGATREPDYGTVAIDREVVVDSRRWRAAHDGVQDVTAVLLLDDAVAEAEKLGVDPGLRDSAKKARATAIAEVTAGEDQNALAFAVLQRNRRAIADALVGLRQAIAERRD
jgi:hypothetical protein